MSSEEAVSTSPIKERSASLQHLLDKRPEPKDLLDRNILHSPPQLSPELAKRQHELDVQLKADQLKHSLMHRPEKDELIQRNILPVQAADGTVAPGLIGKQLELQKNMTEDSLKEKLAARPAVKDVIEKGILLRELSFTVFLLKQADRLQRRKILRSLLSENTPCFLMYLSTNPEPLIPWCFSASHVVMDFRCFPVNLH